MPSAHEVISEQFYRWENRGRGWQVFSHPVTPEPPLIPFSYSFPAQTVDDGRRPTFLSSLIQDITRGLRSTPQSQTDTSIEPDPEPEPRYAQRSDIVELQLSLPRDFDESPEAFGQLLKSVFPCSEPISFEIVGLSGALNLQLAVSQADSSRFKRQIKAFFPDLSISEQKDELIAAWCDTGEAETVIVEFGLAREFMLPLAESKTDPFVGIVAALSELHEGELGLFQVIFEPLHPEWGQSISRSLALQDGKPIFVNNPDLTKAGLAKATQALFGAVVRIAIKSPDTERAWDIARDTACALGVFGSATGNELIPLQNKAYPSDAHEEDVILRQARRTGMILTLDELLGFVHLPSADVPKLGRESTKTKAAPSALTQGLHIGNNTHGGKTVEVRLSPEHRVRHTHIIGASGTGKTTLLFNLLKQDIENGQGLALLDPHGDLVERVLGIIPEARIKDVILLDPADSDYSIGFNILSAHSDLEKHLLASDLVSIFERLSTSWGDQMGSILQNAILAFLESETGGTLADLRRFLIEPAFRTEFLKSVRDPEVIYYWQKAFPQLTGNRSIGPVITRLETFLAPKPIRYMVSQKINRLDFADMMDAGKIFLAKLSDGLLGKENSSLLGALLVAKFQQTVMSRQALALEARRDFWVYMDEFQNFITPSLAEILTGARKYRTGLILAHHELRQLERVKEVASAVLSNSYTRVVFRVGDDDARKLADGFADFDARDIQNLRIGQAICRVERSDADFNLSIPKPEQAEEGEAHQIRKEVIGASRSRYGTARADVEEALQKIWTSEPEQAKEASKVSPKDTVTNNNPIREAVPIAAQLTPAPPPPVPVVPPPLPAIPSIGEVLHPTTPQSPGKGGAQHKEIQRRIKREAEKLGFRAYTEKGIGETDRSIDVLLESDEANIACEISLTTTIDHEVGNVVKCLDAGYKKVAIVCIDAARLTKISVAVSGALGKDRSTSVQYFTPDDFIAYLPSIAPPPPKPKDAVNKRLGYTVKRLAVDLPPEEKNEKERAMIRAMAEAMKKKRQS